MADFFEIDFLDVEAAKSGDAICARYSVGGQTFIHVTDGGYLTTGERVAEHIRKHYGNPKFIDNVVVTHQDGDHTAGLQVVLEEFDVGALWMLRPWIYADELIHRFSRYTSVENLRTRLRADFPNLVALEEIALRRRIPIRSPLQGEAIGAFTVLAPSRARYLDLIVECERTPDGVKEAAGEVASGFADAVLLVVAKAINYVKAAWGHEVFSPEETSIENEMSVVQAATLNGSRILLTGDVGRNGLTEAADYAPHIGWTLPGVDRFQVPHHGSRRNVSTELLDRWLGSRHQHGPAETSFTAIISSAKADKDHPRKAVIRAMIHRGGRVVSTEGNSICTYSNSPDRDGWSPASILPYPEDQEE